MNTVHTKWCHFISFSSDYDVFVTAFQKIGLLNTHLYVQSVLSFLKRLFSLCLHSNSIRWKQTTHLLKKIYCKG